MWSRLLKPRLLSKLLLMPLPMQAFKPLLPSSLAFRSPLPTSTMWPRLLKPRLLSKLLLMPPPLANTLLSPPVNNDVQASAPVHVVPAPLVAAPVAVAKAAITAPVAVEKAAVEVPKAPVVLSHAPVAFYGGLGYPYVAYGVPVVAPKAAEAEA